MSGDFAIEQEARRIEQLEIEYKEIKQELSDLRLKEDKLLIKQEKVEEELRSLKQVVELPSLRKQWQDKTDNVNSLVEKIRKEDENWDYDNYAQQFDG